MIDLPRPHDLLHVRVEPALLHFEQDVEAAFAHLQRCPLVVARRGETRDGRIPIGIRGFARSERYAGWVQPEAILRIERPADLMRYRSDSCLPTLKALDELAIRWRDSAMPWGPTGSVGFELASGISTVTASSDLDVQIRANRCFSKADARKLLRATAGLNAAVDVLVETPIGGFSLAEYALSAKCMLRTDRGPVLTSNPWQDVEAAA